MLLRISFSFVILFVILCIVRIIGISIIPVILRIIIAIGVIGIF